MESWPRTFQAEGAENAKAPWWVSRLGRVPGTERKRENERQGQAALGFPLSAAERWPEQSPCRSVDGRQDWSREARGQRQARGEMSDAGARGLTFAGLRISWEGCRGHARHS